MLCVCVTPPPINIAAPEPVFMKLGIYIMAPESFSAAYFIMWRVLGTEICIRIVSSFYYNLTLRECYLLLHCYTFTQFTISTL
jgi:hypothetical protein